MVTIGFEVPGREAGGYLRRQRSAIAMMQRLTDNKLDPTKVDELVEFLLPFVTEPIDRDEAREALLDASREQFEDMLKKAQGIEPDPTGKKKKPKEEN
jgi:hypothetical protein